MSRRREHPTTARRPFCELFHHDGVPASKLAVIYARFSDADQNPLSIDRQIKNGTRRIAALGLILSAIYVDEGKTATTTDGRRAYQLFLRDARAGLFGVAVVENMSRAHRMQSEAHLLHEELAYLGIELHDTSRQLDDDAVADQAKAAKAFITHQLKLCSEGREQAVEHGKVPGRNAYGYALDPHNSGMHKLDPETSPRVLEIFKRLAGGESTVEIAEDFTVRKLPTPGTIARINWGRAIESPQPAWHYNMVRGIATNPIYKGEVIIRA